MPATRKEEAAPADNCLYPHLLVTGPFADVQAMYRWLNGLAEVDCTLPQAEMLTDEITAGCTDELEKIRRTYAYVQQNIRYIAFENGLAGHRPDRPAEVLRKRYGDCKGMALLLRTLLKAQGFDAQMAISVRTTSPVLPTKCRHWLPSTMPSAFFSIKGKDIAWMPPTDTYRPKTSPKVYKAEKHW